MAYKYTTGVYIGRFQPMHIAHLETLTKALESCQTIIIVIGSFNKARTIKNPFSAEERKQQITQAVIDANLPIERISFVFSRDYMYNDYKWASEIYTRCLVAGATPNHKTALWGCMKDDSSYYLKMFPQWDFNKMPYLYSLDATSIRKELYETQDLGTLKDSVPPNISTSLCTEWITSIEYANLVKEYSFLQRHDKLWEKAPYKPTFVTVDALVIKSGCVLLIRRLTEPGKGLYALPGGYLNPDELITQGMLRELKEETKIAVPKPVLESNIKDTQVFDHPKRSPRGRIITHAHLIDLGYGPLPNVTPGSDAKEAEWVPMADVFTLEKEFFEDHFDIIVNLTSKY